MWEGASRTICGQQKISDTSKSIATCGKNAKEESSCDRQTEVSASKEVVVNAKSDPFQRYSNLGDFRPFEAAMSRTGVSASRACLSRTVLYASLIHGSPYNQSVERTLWILPTSLVGMICLCLSLTERLFTGFIR